MSELIIHMTADEFFDRLKDCLADAVFAPEGNDGVKVKKHYVHGLKGLCGLLGCSTSTAARIKNSGIIDEAISQVGNTIIVDADLALDLIKVRKAKKRRGGAT